jgi:hypothetical protein
MVCCCGGKEGKVVRFVSWWASLILIKLADIDVISQQITDRHRQTWSVAMDTYVLCDFTPCTPCTQATAYVKAGKMPKSN